MQLNILEGLKIGAIAGLIALAVAIEGAEEKYARYVVLFLLFKDYFFKENRFLVIPQIWLLRMFGHMPVLYVDNMIFGETRWTVYANAFRGAVVEGTGEVPEWLYEGVFQGRVHLCGSGSSASTDEEDYL
jgi:hypothetical protein